MKHAQETRARPGAERCAVRRVAGATRGRVASTQKTSSILHSNTTPQAFPRPLEFLISQHFVQLGVTIPVAWSYAMANRLHPLYVAGNCRQLLDSGHRQSTCTGTRFGRASFRRRPARRAPCPQFSRPRTSADRQSILHEELRLQGVYWPLSIWKSLSKCRLTVSTMPSSSTLVVLSQVADKASSSTESHNAHGWCAYRSLDAGFVHTLHTAWVAAHVVRVQPNEMAQPAGRRARHPRLYECIQLAAQRPCQASLASSRATPVCACPPSSSPVSSWLEPPPASSTAGTRNAGPA